jgi:DNA polymerase (family 10)
MRDRSRMSLEYAESIGQEVIGVLQPYFERLEIAGSVRRQKEWVRDIDLVGIPRAATWLGFNNKLVAIADRVVRRGAKLATFEFKGNQVDLYYATEETWSTLLLIRTGSKENNIRLCTLARSKGWHLKANGDGLFDGTWGRIAGDTEESIYEALGLPYREPWERG